MYAPWVEPARATSSHDVTEKATKIKLMSSPRKLPTIVWARNTAVVGEENLWARTNISNMEGSSRNKYGNAEDERLCREANQTELDVDIHAGHSEYEWVQCAFCWFSPLLSNAFEEVTPLGKCLFMSYHERHRFATQ